MNENQVTQWLTLRTLADRWRDSPVVDEYIKQLPRNANTRTQGLPGFLQEAQAGFSFVASMPLRVYTLMPMIEQSPGIDMTIVQRNPDWFASSAKVDMALRDTFEWLRSRLTGYPIVPVPQTVKGTPLTTDEFTDQLISPGPMRRSGFQHRSEPPRTAELLELDASALSPLNRAAVQLGSAFVQSAEVVEYREARLALSTTDKEALAAARSALSAALTPAAVDAYEPDLAMRRHEYRRHQVQESVASLAGAAQRVADAYAAVEERVHFLLSVFEQLVAFGAPTLRLQPDQLSLDAGPPPTTTFYAQFLTTFPDLGMMVWIDDELVPDCQFVEAISHSFATDQGVPSDRLRCRQLVGTAEAWKDLL